MDSNFYYKIRSFRKNFPKNSQDYYINTDFRALNDLATLDMRLRYILLHMTLDIEHTLKTKIVKDITLDKNEDGVSIVDEFLCQASNKNLNEYYKPISSTRHPNHGIYQKHNPTTPPIWVFCELMTFGDLVAFIEFYSKKSASDSSYYEPLATNLKFVKNIRNLAAHNSPILNELSNKNQFSKQKHRNRFLHNYLLEVGTISKKAIRSKAQNIRIHDLSALLFVYHSYINSSGIKDNRYSELNEFLTRAKRNESLYTKHSDITSVYTFFRKIVDFNSKNY